jgi:cysteine desulfurase
MASAAWLAGHEGAQLERIPVERNGQVDVDALTEMVEVDPDSVALISVMAANNEVGTVQPLDEVAAVADPHGIPVHTDAVQSLGPLGLDFAASGLVAASVSAHKLGGPIGIGALVLRRGAAAVPVLHGGGQERDIRSGTVPAPLCAAFGAAAVAARDARPVEVPRLRALRHELVSRVTALVPDVVVNGDPHDVLPGTANLTFPGCRSDDLLLLLDEAGVACSGGSACHSGVLEPSEVLLAMGVGPVAATQSLRFSLGHDSTDADVDALVVALPAAVERARAAALVATGA